MAPKPLSSKISYEKVSGTPNTSPLGRKRLLEKDWKKFSRFRCGSIDGKLQAIMISMLFYCFPYTWEMIQFDPIWLNTVHSYLFIWLFVHVLICYLFQTGSDHQLPRCRREMCWCSWNFSIHKRQGRDDWFPCRLKRSFLCGVEQQMYVCIYCLLFL